MADTLNAPLTGHDLAPKVAHAEKEIRLGFIRKVYGILTAQLLVTVLIAAPIAELGKQWTVENQWLLMLSSVMTLVTILAMMCCRDATMSFPTNYICLTVFTAFEAVTVGFLCAQYTVQSVLLAFGLTAAIFASLTVYAWTTKTDFTGLGPYLFAGLIAMLLMSMLITLLSFLGFQLSFMVTAWSALGVLLFTFYIVYDTQLMLGSFGGHQTQFGVDEYVFAALSLYLDIINLFVYILQLFGNRD